jgi:hypothetical protein
VDGLNRVWPVLASEYKNYKYAFAGTDGANSVLFHDNKYPYLDFFRLLGIPKENILKVDKPTQFRSVLLPQKSFMSNYFKVDKRLNINRLFADTFLTIAKNVPKDYPYTKIYLSRAKYRHPLGANTCYGERQLERIFEKNGYKIIYPDEHSLEEQVALMKNCQTLAAVDGTALHQCLFMQDRTKVICLNRVPDGVNHLQMFIEKVKNLEPVYIDASLSGDITMSRGREGAFFVGASERFRAFLKDNNFIYDDEDLKIDKEEYLDFLIASGQVINMFTPMSDLWSTWWKRWKGVLIRLSCFFVLDKDKRRFLRAKARAKEVMKRKTKEMGRLNDKDRE